MFDQADSAAASESEKEVSETTFTGQDVGIVLDSSIKNALAKQLQSAIANNASTTNGCSVQLVIQNRANLNDQTASTSRRSKSTASDNEGVFNRKTLFSTCVKDVNKELDVAIPFKYNKTSLDSVNSFLSLLATNIDIIFFRN